MRVAVTGASGFVGRYVLHALSAMPGLEVVASSRGEQAVEPPWPAGVRHVPLDLASPSADDYERLGRPEVLIHLAWAGLPNYRSVHHFETELPRQYLFLRTLVESGLPSLLVTGTCYEYGMVCGELSESQPARPANAYAYAKDALRQQLEYLRAKSPFQFTWGRVFFMYGEGQRPTSLYTQLMAAIERREPSFKMSGGEHLRDFLPVQEVARTVVELGLRHGDAGIVNICSGRPTSVRNLVEQLLRERGVAMPLELGAYPYPDHEPMAFWGSSRHLHDVLSRSAKPA